MERMVNNLNNQLYEDINYEYTFSKVINPKVEESNLADTLMHSQDIEDTLSNKPIENEKKYTSEKTYNELFLSYAENSANKKIWVPLGVNNFIIQDPQNYE